MSDTNITIGCYYDANTGASAYSDMLSEAIEQASYVVCLSAVSAGFDAIQDYSVQIQGVKRAMSDAQASGAKFVLLSDNIPVDTVRFESADAIVCAYLSSGFDIDPTTGSGSENMRAINANVPAALRAIFGMGDMPGILPINIPELIQGDDGLWRYSEGLAYERGYHVQ
jgi:beta-N-acetylhexosaminidase